MPDKPNKPEVGSAKVKVESKLPHSVSAGGVVVKPGDNELAAEDWAKIVAVQPLRLLVHAGKLVPFASSSQAKLDWYAKRSKKAKASSPKPSKEKSTFASSEK